MTRALIASQWTPPILSAGTSRHLVELAGGGQRKWVIASKWRRCTTKSPKTSHAASALSSGVGGQQIVVFPSRVTAATMTACSAKDGMLRIGVASIAANALAVVEARVAARNSAIVLMLKSSLSEQLQVFRWLSAVQQNLSAATLAAISDLQSE